MQATNGNISINRIDKILKENEIDDSHIIKKNLTGNDFAISFNKVEATFPT